MTAPLGADARRPRAVALAPDDFPWQPLDVGGEAEVRTVLGPDRSDTIGAGFVRFRDTAFEWDLSYDEVLYMIEGELAVEADGETVTAGPGDVLSLPSGSRVTYRFRGACLAFFATYPVNWEELTDV